MRMAISTCLPILMVCAGVGAKCPAADGAAPKAITNSVGMKLVLIPPGEFMMGSRESVKELFQAYRAYNAPPTTYFEEEPRHRVRITREFYLGAHEVTVGQFRQFVEATGYKTDAERDGRGASCIDPATGERDQKPEYTWRSPGFPQTDDHPVVNVSWNDAKAFCEWLSRKEGKTYRLPSEAQWEYACRAGTTTRYCYGNDPEGLARVDNIADAAMKSKLPRVVNGNLTMDVDWAISATDGHAFTAPVGSFRPNGFALYDMHGNVTEWCADWFSSGYYARSPAKDPSGAKSGKARITRGASWSDGPNAARSAQRGWEIPDKRFDVQGFRVAREP